MGDLIKYGVLGAVVLVVVVVGHRKYKSHKMSEEIAVALAAMQKDGKMPEVDDLRRWYIGGDEARRNTCRMLLVATHGPQDHGAWRLSGVDKTLTASSGNAVDLSAEPSTGLVLRIIRAAWGETTGAGTFESPAWVTFALGNFSGSPITVARDDFFIFGRKYYALSSVDFGQEVDNIRPTLGNGKALTSAVFLATFYDTPTTFGFCNGEVLVRVKLENVKPINDYRRTKGGWPGDDALKQFPVRTAFTQQIGDGKALQAEAATTAPKAAAPARPPVDETKEIEQAVTTATGAAESPLDRSWTSASGKQIEAVLIGFKDGNVKLRRDRDGKEFTIPLAALSDEDQAFVKAAVAHRATRRH